MVFIIDLLAKLIGYYQWALVIYILMSWFPNARSSSIGQLLGRICYPITRNDRHFTNCCLFSPELCNSRFISASRVDRIRKRSGASKGLIEWSLFLLIRKLRRAIELFGLKVKIYVNLSTFSTRRTEFY